MSNLPDNLTMGPVTLRVANRDLMQRYYQETLGLEFLGEHGGRVTLGRGSTPTLVLEHTPSLKHAGPSEAGLFHTAFLFDTPAELSTAVVRVAQEYPGSFTGSADHIVSEAFYFDDPEGNGVELYVDRDRSGWSWPGGSIHMDTLPLDPNAYLQKHLTDAGPAASVIGHVHLCVGDLEQAHAFYVEVLGFDVTLNYRSSALFVSAGGYHHHMAMNIWRSRGATRRGQTLGLGNVDIHVPSLDSLSEVQERLVHHGLAVTNDGQTLRLDDPWGNQVSLQVGPAPE